MQIGLFARYPVLTRRATSKFIADVIPRYSFLLLAAGSIAPIVLRLRHALPGTEEHCHATRLGGGDGGDRLLHKQCTQDRSSVAEVAGEAAARPVRDPGHGLVCEHSQLADDAGGVHRIQGKRDHLLSHPQRRLALHAVEYARRTAPRNQTRESAFAVQSVPEIAHRV